MTSARFAVAVGSNLGDRTATIAAAAERVIATGDVQLCAASPLYANPAVGGPSGQNEFLNGAWVVATALTPLELLRHLLAVEADLGRERRVYHGPRPIDLDLLLAFDGRCVQGDELVMPHPRLHERAFVLGPLREVAADWQHPILRQSIEELWWRLDDSARSALRARS